MKSLHVFLLLFVSSFVFNIETGTEKTKNILGRTFDILKSSDTKYVEILEQTLTILEEQDSQETKLAKRSSEKIEILERILALLQRNVTQEVAIIKGILDVLELPNLEAGFIKKFFDRLKDPAVNGQQMLKDFMEPTESSSSKSEINASAKYSFLGLAALSVSFLLVKNWF